MPNARTNFKGAEAGPQFSISQKICSMGLYTAVYSQSIQPRTVMPWTKRPSVFGTQGFALTHGIALIDTRDDPGSGPLSCNAISSSGRDLVSCSRLA